jgi:hypothetical protein
MPADEETVRRPRRPPGSARSRVRRSGFFSASQDDSGVSSLVHGVSVVPNLGS